MDLTTTAIELIQLYGPLAVAVFTFLESSMLFPFLPSEVVVPAAAAVLVTDAVSFVVFVAAAGIGGTAGAFVLFYGFYGSGTRLVDWLQEYVPLSDEEIARSRRWFLEWGVSSVFWGRFLPGLRSVISIPAGLFGMNPVWFGVFTVLGTVGFYATVAAVVYFLQQRSIPTAIWNFVVARPVISLAVLVVGLVVTVLITVSYHRAGDG